MQATQNKYLLKVVSGPHQGAELDLPLGDFILGSADECDVILSDPQVAPRHARVSLSTLEINVEPLSPAVYLDGKLVRSKRIKVEPYQYLTLGHTYVVFGPGDAPWPTISTSRLPALENPSAPTVTNGPAQSAAEALNPAAPSTPVPAVETPPPATMAIASPREIANRRALLSSLLPALILLAVLIIAALKLFWPDALKRAVVETPYSATALASKAADKVDELHDPNVEVAPLENGQVSVTGYVDTLEQRQALRGAMRDLGDRHIVVQVYCTELILKDCRDIAAAMNLPLTFASPAPGTVTVRGYVPEKEMWINALRHFEHDIRGVKPPVKGSVLTADDALAIAKTALSDEKLLGAISVQATGNQLVATGLLAGDQIDDWARAKSAIDKKLDGLLSLTDRTKQAPAQTAKEMVDAEIAGIIVGDLSWISLKNGSRYFTGGVLPNGYVITDIKPNAVYLQKNDDSIVLKAGDSIWSKIK